MAERNAGLRERHGEFYKAQWEPIVSKADLMKARSILRNPERTTKRTSRSCLPAACCGVGSAAESSSVDPTPEATPLRLPESAAEPRLRWHDAPR